MPEWERRHLEDSASLQGWAWKREEENVFLKYWMCLDTAIFGQVLCYRLVREGWLVGKGGWIGLGLFSDLPDWIGSEGLRIVGLNMGK